MNAMRFKKLLFLILVSYPFLSCNNRESQTNYSVVLNIREIFLNGKSFQFNPVKTLTLNPNSDTIEKISLEDDNNIGVKYILTEKIDSDGMKLHHNAVFFEFNNGNWIPFTELDHLEPASLDPKTYWKIATEVDGIQRFAVEFNYTLNPR